MPEQIHDLKVERLLKTQTLAVHDVVCAGTCRGRSVEECSSITHLVFPYRGVYLRHVGRQQAVADANQVLFFNATESYQVSHPAYGGDHNLVVVLAEEVLRELAPAPLLLPEGALRFREQHRRIDPGAQARAALLRHRLARGALTELDAETISLELISHTLGARTSHGLRATPARRHLVDRVKLLLLSDLSRRWTLAEIASRTGGSPVYLTQLFQQIEGVPLHRYHLRLRLARALDLVPHHEDLTLLALQLGFSSHSHFSAAFQQTYGRTPSGFRAASR